MAPKNKPNAFFMFMKDWKAQQEKRGRYFPNGMKDVQQDPECHEAWKYVSDKRRASYKEQMH